MENIKRLSILTLVWLLLPSFRFEVYIPPVISLNEAAKKAILDRHNYYRKEVGVPPLKWSDELAEYAQEWADKLAKSCKLEHRTGDGYGENIYWYSSKQSPKEVVDYWAQEEELFNHRRRKYKYGKGYGHYTQIIWRDTKFIGAAVANCRNGGQIWVCNYDPPGNWQDEKVY